MASRSLHVTSTPFPVHQALADWVCDHLARAGFKPLNGVASEHWRRIDELARTPEAAVVVLVDHPAAALAHWQAKMGSVESMLLEWCDCVRRMLTLAHSRPFQWLFVDSAEALADPAAFAAAFSRLDPDLSLDIPNGVAAGLATPTDIVAESIVDTVVRADPYAVSLHEELRASCVALSGSLSPHEIDALSALAQYRRQVTQLGAMAGQLRQLESDVLQARTWRNERDVATNERVQLVLALHQVQDEFERFVAQASESKGESRDRESSAKLSVVETQETGPHRHVCCELERLRLPGRSIEAAEVRLVEHRLRPGLALFRQRTGAAPLSTWQPDGHEGGRDFMLLVPADVQSRGRLERLPASDWRAVMAIAKLLEGALAESSATMPRWRLVAARLMLQLNALPPRFRYDGVEAHPKEEPLHEMTVRFHGVVFGDRDVGTVQLGWAHTRRVLEWDAPAASEPLPFGAWPVDASGLPVPSWRVPVGACASKDKRKQWQALQAAERQLVLGLLDALPAIGGSTIAADASALYKEARRTVASLSVRQTVRRLLGRSA